MLLKDINSVFWVERTNDTMAALDGASRVIQVQQDLGFVNHIDYLYVSYQNLHKILDFVTQSMYTN